MDINQIAQSNNIFKHFIALNKIPRCSNNEEDISNYLRKLGENLGYDSYQDEFLNVIIRKPASEGYEDKATVALQAHMDMVCEKSLTSEHNFKTDPIEMHIDDDFLKAKETTLGADNGIGIALALSILEDKNLRHPDLELVFTATEETGMDGVIGLSDQILKANKLINIDTEDEGVMIIGCAGGNNASIRIPMKFEQVKDLHNIELTVSGLKGGHSGLTIGSDHINAIKLIGEILSRVRSKFDIHLQNLTGGTKHNAIPSQASAILGVEAEVYTKLKHFLKEEADELISKYLKRESNINIVSKDGPEYDIYFNQDLSKEILNAINLLPNGVHTVDKHEIDNVESSNNLATARMVNDIFEISLSIRSSNSNEKQVLMDKISEVARIIDAKVDFTDGYPMWQPNYDSELAKLAKRVYEDLFDKEMLIETIHAGLETGMLSQKYPQMDMISIGPDIYGAHTPSEKVSISSTNRIYDYLVELLANL